MNRYKCSLCGEELSKEEVREYLDKHEGLDFNWGKCRGKDAHLVLIKRKSDYETIDGELYLRASAVVKAILGSPNFENGSEEEFLEQDLGLDKKGERI